MTIRRGELTKAIGERIAHGRRLLGWSQTKLASEADVSQTQVTVWEKGAGIQEATLKKIADILGTTMEFLLTGKDASIDTILLKVSPRDYFDELRSATRLCVSGLNLGRFIPNDISIIQEICAKKDGHVKALLMDGIDDNACKFGAAQEYGDASLFEAYRATIVLAHSLLKPLLRGGKLELRSIEYPIPFGLDVVDAEPPAGIVYVRGYPFRKAPSQLPNHNEPVTQNEPVPDQPILKFNSASPEQKYWHEFYKRQFYISWAMAKEVRA
jgi:transcriptional regulator with XRE-family HTH domain